MDSLNKYFNENTTHGNVKNSNGIRLDIKN